MKWKTNWQKAQAARREQAERLHFAERTMYEPHGRKRGEAGIDALHGPVPLDKEIIR